MTDDAVNWVTVRIHEPVRDDAKELDPTYTEIMQAGINAIKGTGRGGKSIQEIDNLEAEAFFERLSGLEDIAGANNEQREHFRAILEDVESQLDRIEDAATTAEERTGSIERTLEGFQ